MGLKKSWISGVITGVANDIITFGEALIVDNQLNVILAFIMGVKPVAVATWKKEKLQL